MASNPSGISACYNIRTLNNSTGAFNAQLSLYRIASASGDWTQLQNSGVSIGMAYPDATVTMQSHVTWKRGEMFYRGPIMHAVDQHLEKRSSIVAPRMLQTLLFDGQVHNGSIGGLEDEYVYHSELLGRGC